MKEIITSIQDLRTISAPVKVLTEQGIDKTEGDEIITALKATMEANPNVVALAAPQIGINSRIFCIKFNDTIKTFINPVVTKKANYSIKPESFVSMPGKEILITRPEELTVVYFTDDYKYEENKLLGAAARLFDQQCQLLDGVVPEDLGLVSDVETDGSLADLSEDEINQVIEIYKQYINIKTKGLQERLAEDPELAKQYSSLCFTEKVINGKAAIVAGDGEEQEKAYKKAQSVAAMSLKNAVQTEKQLHRNHLEKFLRHKGK
jgi:peptide deformylase